MGPCLWGLRGAELGKKLVANLGEASLEGGLDPANIGERNGLLTPYGVYTNQMDMIGWDNAMCSSTY